MYVARKYKGLVKKEKKTRQKFAEKKRKRLLQQERILGLNIDFFLKGQCHEMDIFFNGLNILISTFCVFVNGFQGLSKAFNYPIQLLTFYLLF
jgi:hypothetical protein